LENRTVIDVLDEVFDGRDYDLNLLSPNETKTLSNKLTEFALGYTSPPRLVGQSRYYGGGTSWNTDKQSKSRVWFGPAGLLYGADMEIAQTLCLMHDSIVCHDAVTDLLGNHSTEFLPSFHNNIIQGECSVDTQIFGTQPLSDKLIANTAARLNPTLRVYDCARELIQRGFIIPVPSRVLIRQNEKKFLTQFRHSQRDSEMMKISAESVNIAVSDGSTNSFLYPQGSKIRFGNAAKDPHLRLHYGLLHHLKCYLVACKANADFLPSDDFGWRTLEYKIAEYTKSMKIRSLAKLSKTAASATLAIPIVQGFSPQDIVSIRRDELVFEELRKILRKTTEPSLSGQNMSEFYKDYQAQLSDAIEQWWGKIAKSSNKMGLFRSAALTGGSAICLAGALIFQTEAPVSKFITVAGGLPGLYYGIKDLLTGGADPKRRLFKILRRYRHPGID
jgi:hypothetical protein